MKRKSKQKREAELYAALRQRVADIACGALGGNFDHEDEFATADFLERFMPALKVVFGTEDNGYAFGLHCLGHFNNIDTTTKHLWDCKVRA